MLLIKICTAKKKFKINHLQINIFKRITSGTVMAFFIESFNQEKNEGTRNFICLFVASAGGGLTLWADQTFLDQRVIDLVGICSGHYPCIDRFNPALTCRRKR